MSLQNDLQSLRRQQQNGQLLAVETGCRQLLSQADRKSEWSAVAGLLSCVLLQTDRTEEAEQLLTVAAQTIDKIDPLALADLAGGYLLSNRPETALAYMAEARLLKPESAIIQGRYGMTLLKLGRLTEAEEALEVARQLAPELTAFRVNLAQISLLMGKPQAALELLTDPTPALTSLARRVRIEALLGLKRHGAAKAAAQTWLQVSNHGDPEAIGLYALVLAAENRHDEAAAFLLDAHKRFPGNVELTMQLAELAMLRGRFAEAMTIIGRGLRHNRNDCSLWCQLSRAASLDFALKPALAAAQKAIELSANKTGPSRAEALGAMAHVQDLLDATATAEKLYQEALTGSENLPHIRLGFGHLLLRMGRIDEAIEQFTEVNARQPAAGFRALVAAHHFPDKPEILEQIEGAAQQPSLQGPLQSNLLFALATAWEKLGNHKKAFKIAKEANNTIKSLLSYDAKKHRERINRTVAVFSEDFFAERTGFGLPSELPLFIVGMPRSGTTLVEQILASHPHVFGAGELGQIPNLIVQLQSWEQHIASGNSYPDCITDLTDAECLTMAAATLDQLQTHDHKARRIVDKLPHNFENIGLIHLFFPNAIIIHLRREPRDVAISNYFTDYQARFGGMGFAYDLQHIGEQIADEQRLMAHWKRLLPNRILTIDYETLIQEPETETKKILQHCRLPWDARVLQFDKLQRTVKTASVWQVRQPLYKTSIGRWQNYADHLQPLQRAMKTPPIKSTIKPPSPTLPPGSFIRAMKLLHKEQNSVAAAIFLEILQHFPQHAAAEHFLGIAYFRLGHKQQGLQRVLQSVKLNPNRQQWFENLAKIYRNLGQTAQEQAAQEAAKRLHAVPEEPWRLLFAELSCEVELSS